MSEFGVIKTKKVRMTAMTFALMMKELDAGASTVAQLQEATGLAKATLYDYLRELRKAGLVYVAGFDRAANNCPMIPLYEWGPGKKDKKVKAISVAEKARNYRRNKRDREALGRLTLLGQRTGSDADQEAGGDPPLQFRPDHGRDQMVQREARG